ncbi:MAG: DUF1559 domain-containing protein [Planctomycetia bacterium]|nr:DUF1559 domain-containing protein [Planctomycetia bacterium]
MSHKRGFTLVELLVVIAIIGMLVGLLLPAVQQAREAARRMQCSNQVGQLAKATMNYESAMRKFPSGGWNYSWTGAPDREGCKQMGSWCFSLLPYIEQDALRQSSMGASSTTVTQANLKVQLESSVPGFTCPSRRTAKAYSVSSSTSYKTAASSTSTSEVSASPTMISKTDYAGNYGTNNSASNAQIGNDSSSMTLSATCKPRSTNIPTGIFYDRSEVTIGAVRDGTSNTYMIGEKFLQPTYYETEDTDNSHGDRFSMFCGADRSNLRGGGHYVRNSSGSQLTNDTVTAFKPMQDRETLGTYSIYSFGSSHAGGFQMAMCDASVHSISYDVDGYVNAALANKSDMRPAQLPE